MSLLRNIIRLGTITQIFNKFGIIRSQTTSLDAEQPENIINLHPYGFNACPPVGSNMVVMSVFGHLENKYGIPFNPTDANKQKLQSGETVIYNHYGSQIYLKANGDIEIVAAKDINITGGTTKINGNAHITGNLIVDGNSTLTGSGTSIAGKTFLTHTHTGVTTGGGNSGGVT